MKLLQISAVAVGLIVGAASSVSAQGFTGRAAVSSYSSYTAEIQSDGNLRGVLQLIDAKMPVDGVAQVTFIRNGTRIARATADENGVFQVRGLIPGTYSVVATARNRFAAFSLTVLPHQLPQGGAELKQAGFARANQTEFTIPLTAASDFQLISQVVQEEAPPETETPPPPGTIPVTTGGGGGGGGVGPGGGGGMAAIFATGLGVAAGLAFGLDDDDPPASPSTP
jgi:hypothetical protein